MDWSQFLHVVFHGPPLPRPGAITPLGVRVDRGSGLLGSSGTQSTLGEMDCVLSGIRAWKQKHEREMVGEGGATGLRGECGGGQVPYGASYHFKESASQRKVRASG